MEDILDFIEGQLAEWPLARENYAALGKTERKPVALGPNLTGAIQWNPARIVSTGAKTDKESIAKRPCFLCSANRPKEQWAAPILDGWELLVNPFPIFPVHFTIASKSHEPQTTPPLEMASMADKLEGLAVFFNGAKAGASAPDHAHCQAVLKSELPLLNLSERLLREPAERFLTGTELNAGTPMEFMTAIITPDRQGMRLLAASTHICGNDPTTGESDPGLVNAFYWKDESGLLRFLATPRRRHRPACWSAEGEERLIVSPGAIDMTGILIVPRETDYRRIDEKRASAILREVSV